MTEDHRDLTDTVRDAADRIDEKLEPKESDRTGGPTTDASDPFANDRRPEETGYPHGSVAGTD